jgi:hypothetical protein
MQGSAIGPLGASCSNWFYNAASCPSVSDGQARIAGGGTTGRLEVFHAGQWGTVCDDSFENVDAIVACSSMGFTSGTVVSSTSVPDGTGQVWLDDLGCIGTEPNLGA